VWFGESLSFDDSTDLFSNVAKSKEIEPSEDLDVVPNKVIAGVGFVAANDTGEKNTAVGLNIAQSDVMHCNKWLSFTVSERVEHASGTSATRLLLLLGSNVDVEPDWVVDLKVLVGDVGNFSAGTR